MQIETKANVVVSLLLKGEDYETLCPNNEDVWYDQTEVLNNAYLKRLLSVGTVELLKQGKIDYIACRGNW